MVVDRSILVNRSSSRISPFIAWRIFSPSPLMTLKERRRPSANFIFWEESNWAKKFIQGATISAPRILLGWFTSGRAKTKKESHAQRAVCGGQRHCPHCSGLAEFPRMTVVLLGGRIKKNDNDQLRAKIRDRRLVAVGQPHTKQPPLASHCRRFFSVDNCLLNLAAAGKCRNR